MAVGLVLELAELRAKYEAEQESMIARSKDHKQKTRE